MADLPPAAESIKVTMQHVTRLLIVALLSSNAHAACDSDPHRAFDFWIGTWEVRTTEGQLAGTNTISAEEQGCLLVERWSGVRGSTGQSYNFYDPGSKRWHQVWVSQAANILYSGNLADGAMVLQGEITYRNGQTAEFMGRWTPQPDGTVRQHLQQRDADGAWQDWFIGIYQRTDAQANSERPTTP